MSAAEATVAAAEAAAAAAKADAAEAAEAAARGEERADNLHNRVKARSADVTEAGSSTCVHTR